MAKAMKATKATKKRAKDGGKLDDLVAQTLGKLSEDLLSRGSIHVEIVDQEGVRFLVQRGGHIEAGPAESAAVRIRGSAERIKALLGGKKHPSAVFVEGGIEVAGDVQQITALSEELPVLTLGRRRS